MDIEKQKEKETETEEDNIYNRIETERPRRKRKFCKDPDYVMNESFSKSELFPTPPKFTILTLNNSSSRLSPSISDDTGIISNKKSNST